MRGLVKAREITVSGLLEGDVVCDELHIEAGGQVQAVVTSKEMSISPKGSFIGERKRWEQGAADSALETLSSDIDAIDSLPEKVVLNQE